MVGITPITASSKLAAFPTRPLFPPLDERIPRALRTPATFAESRETNRIGISASSGGNLCLHCHHFLENSNIPSARSFCVTSLQSSKSQARIVSRCAAPCGFHAASPDRLDSPAAAVSRGLSALRTRINRQSLKNRQTLAPPKVDELMSKRTVCRMSPCTDNNRASEPPSSYNAFASSRSHKIRDVVRAGRPAGLHERRLSVLRMVRAIHGLRRPRE